jgi:flagellar biosynthetic protein FliQ
MDFDLSVVYLREAYWNILIIAGPLLAVSLIVGLLVGMFQAATSINDASIGFVPKLLIALATLWLVSGFMLVKLSDYFHAVFDTISAIH